MKIKKFIILFFFCFNLLLLINWGHLLYLKARTEGLALVAKEQLELNSNRKTHLENGLNFFEDNIENLTKTISIIQPLLICSLIVLLTLLKFINFTWTPINYFFGYLTLTISLLLVNYLEITMGVKTFGLSFQPKFNFYNILAILFYLRYFFLIIFQIKYYTVALKSEGLRHFGFWIFSFLFYIPELIFFIWTLLIISAFSDFSLPL